MSAAFVALIALLSVLSHVDAQNVTLAFRRMTQSAPWPARYAATVEQLDMQIKVGTTTYPTGSFVLHGGHSSNTSLFNDVWISSTLGVSWTCIAGGTGGTATYTPTAFAGYTKDDANRLFRVGGRNVNHQLVNDVWMSSNGGVSWTRQPVTAATRFGPRQFIDVISSPQKTGVDALYLVGGLEGAANSGPGTNDAWVSVDSGRTWKTVGNLPAVAPPGRSSGSLLSHNPVQRAGQNVLFYLGGQGRSATGTMSYFNDVYISSNNGVNWDRISRAASWTRRGNFNAEITASGAIILSSGFNENRGVAGGSLNDIWASMDGGWSWGLCVEDAQFSDRSFIMSMMDNAGYFYVMGGNEGYENVNGSSGRVQKNDVWRSSWSLNDPQLLSQLCKIPVPACGVGLTCLPSDTNSKYDSNGQVTCPAIEACRSDRLSFSLSTLQAEWPARHSSGFEMWNGKDTKIGGVTYKKGSFVLWSGTGPDNSYLTDTWVSTDALTWAEVPTAQNARFQGAGWSGHIIDHSGRLFKIGGQHNQSTRVGDVYMSTDMGQRWVLQKPSRSGRALPPREFPDVFVDSKDNLYAIGGLNGDGLNDVWMSSNQGKDWNRQGFIPFDAPGGRSSASLLIWNNPLLNQEMMMYMGGMSRAGDRQVYYNDIWVSSNLGIRWVRLTERAPFAARDNFNSEVTEDGLIIVSSGYNARTTYNDLWVTADGGYTWTACVEEAQFSDRRWQMNAIDKTGNLVVVGGQEIERSRMTLANDVWKSSVSFSKGYKTNSALRKACPALKVPTCQSGLSCWPTEAIVKDNKAATCPTLQKCVFPDEPDWDSTGSDEPDCDPDWEDCPEVSSSTGAADASSGLSTGAIILIAILVIVGVVAIAGYFYYKRKAQADAQAFGQEGLLNSSNVSFADLSTNTAPQTAQV